MTVRKTPDGRFEVKIVLTTEKVVSIYCDTLEHATELDKVSRVNKKVVNGEQCDLAELESALDALGAAGVRRHAPLHKRLAAKARELLNRK